MQDIAERSKLGKLFFKSMSLQFQCQRFCKIVIFFFSYIFLQVTVCFPSPLDVVVGLECTREAETNHSLKARLHNKPRFLGTSNSMEWSNMRNQPKSQLSFSEIRSQISRSGGGCREMVIEQKNT